MHSRLSYICVAVLMAGCEEDKTGDLGPCEIDSSGWGDNTYNFTRDGLFFGCQPVAAENFFVYGFTGILFTDADAFDAVAAAASAWEQATIWNFDAVASSSPPASNNQQSDFAAVVGSSVLDDQLADKWVNVDGNDLECDVQFWTQYTESGGVPVAIPWSLGTQAGHYDFGTVVVHEMGHCMGLGHPDSETDHPDSVMQEQVALGQSKYSLSAIDKSAMEYLYGSPATTSSGP